MGPQRAPACLVRKQNTREGSAWALELVRVSTDRQGRAAKSLGAALGTILSLGYRAGPGVT